MTLYCVFLCLYGIFSYYLSPISSQSPSLCHSPPHLNSSASLFPPTPHLHHPLQLHHTMASSSSSAALTSNPTPPRNSLCGSESKRMENLGLFLYSLLVSFSILEKLYGESHIAIGNELIKLASIQFSMGQEISSDYTTRIVAIFSRYYGSHAEIMFPYVRYLKKESCRVV